MLLLLWLLWLVVLVVVVVLLLLFADTNLPTTEHAARIVTSCRATPHAHSKLTARVSTLKRHSTLRADTLGVRHATSVALPVTDTNAMR